MSEYITSVISAAILSGVASVMTPVSWRRYTGIVTGIMLLCAVAAPAARIDMSELFAAADNRISVSDAAEGEELRMKMIHDELARRIGEDIERRMKDEFGAEIKASADIGTDKEGRITGVNGIEIEGRLTEAARKRLCEVYGVEKISVK